MKNNKGSLTIIAIFTVLLFSLYGILLFGRSASSYIRQSKSIETIQKAYAQDVPNAVYIAEKIELDKKEGYKGGYYTITIDADNGTEVTTTKLKAGLFVQKPSTPEKEGKGFDNWYYTDENG